MSIYRNERDMIIEQLWKVVMRDVGPIDDAGCDWFTIGNDTFIASAEWQVSDEPEVARCVNAINALKGFSSLIYRSYEDAKAGGMTGHFQQ